MRKRLFWILVALQALVPVAIAAAREADVAFAPHVLLRVEPVDPRDPFRGQYVALRYDIAARVPAGADEGTTVYVPLHREGPGWTGDYATTTLPDGGRSIRGRVRNGRVEFGIEQFYADEGEARRWETALATDRVYADVALGRDGRPTLRRLVTR